MTTSLLPCPFCNGSPTSRAVHSDVPGTEDGGYWEVGCLSCGIVFHEDEESEAGRRWNVRPYLVEMEEIKKRMEDTAKVSRRVMKKTIVLGKALRSLATGKPKTYPERLREIMKIAEDALQIDP